MKRDLSAYYLAGPTGSGKSGAALELAIRCDGEIVNADAFQIYRGLEVLSAAPDAEARARVPHHLYGALDLSEECDAQRFRELAVRTIEEVAGRGKVPIVTGGSGLYLKALTHGLSDTPPASPELRSSMDAMSLDELVAWLRRLDPEGAAAMNLKNRRYVSRGIEISLLSGRPMSEVKKGWDEPRPGLRGVILRWDRDVLYQRINDRTAAMLNGGAIEEVLRGDAGDGFSVTSTKAIGVPEIRRYLDGRLTLDECREAIQQATRHYAKRQETWFRREKAFQTVCLSEEDTARSACDRILKLFPELVS